MIGKPAIEPRALTRTAVVIAGIGVVGELVLLRHLLVNCYPFKMFTYPPSGFYAHLGNFGSLAILAAMALLTIVIARKRAAFLPLIMTVLTPLLYFGLVVAMTAALYGWTVPPNVRNFDDYTIAYAISEFEWHARELAMGGAVVGGICTAILCWLEHRWLR